MKLSLLLEALEVREFRGDPDMEIAEIRYDSRMVRPGDMFVAVKGHALDGHDFVDDAVAKGAGAVVAQRLPSGFRGPAAIVVEDSRRALSRLAARFYGRPWENMTVVGVTGTNGKTTTSYLLESILGAAGFMPGVIGTIEYRFGGRCIPAAVTTPESLDLMRTLRWMADAGATHVVMEVSSHALDQGRIRDCPVDVAVFTNLSRDHLDYHGDMDSYFQAKSILFRGLGKERLNGRERAVVNLDDPRGGELAALARAPVFTYGLGPDCDLKAEAIRFDRRGLSAILDAPGGKFAVHSPLLGRYNVYNILAAAGAALCLGVDPEDVAEGVGRLEKVPGRLEPVKNARGLFILVDYAHTPDALLKALEAVRPLAKGRLITVFGCGGDRDRGKRKEMGLAAGQNSDLVIVTSDNPRTEDPHTIISQVEEGVSESGMAPLQDAESAGDGAGGYLVEPDRERAIHVAVAAAGPEDLVLIAGKGHEDYQIVGMHKRPFDDRVVAGAAAAGRDS